MEDEHEGIVLPPKWMMQNVGQREVLDPTIVDLEAAEEEEAARAQGVFYGDCMNQYESQLARLYESRAYTVCTVLEMFFVYSIIEN